MPYSDGPRLLADIGGTYARFALEHEPGRLDKISALKCADFPDFLSALRGYLASVNGDDVRHAAVAIANPVEGDYVRMTNYHWQFSIEETRAAIGLDTLLVVNDFTALAMGVPYLAPDQCRQIGGGQARQKSVIGLVGAGTGLGVSALIPADDGWVSLGSEGGHVSFSPQDPREVYILEYAWRQYSHVSAERLVSGAGIELIYRALAERSDRPVEPLPAPEIARRAVAGECDLCNETVEVFCGMLGVVAANLAVTLGAFGGIYIGGGIAPRLGDYFDRSQFRQRFEAKGRFSAYVGNIPTFLITADTPTFVGTSAILEAQLRRRNAASPIIDRIRQARDDLSPAERRVADLVLAQPRSVLNDPIMDIARRADVSQPTVIRFCRSLGCEGLSDFKLKLASGLTGTIPVTHTQVKRGDSTLELGAKVLDNTASAVLQVRDQLNRDAIEKAIELLLNARRIEFYGVGNYGVVAQDAQYKFLRFGVSTVAYSDPRLQILAAGVLTAQDVVVAISGTGKINELLQAVDAALAQGAAVIAITPSQSPLAKRATVPITVDHAEDVTTQIPMISRILHLLIIDILAVGVAMRRENEIEPIADELSAAGWDVPKPAKPGTKPQRGGPDLARIISHSG